MHELSLLNEIVKTVENYAKENPGAGICMDGSCEAHAQGARIATLTLEVGELGSAVPEYLMSMWPQAVSGTLLDGAELIIKRIPAVGMCRDCGSEFAFREARGICSACGSKNVTLKSGREFFIKELSLHEG
jgi:hydrogenase nickel incorporation protein HypA/HybF